MDWKYFFKLFVTWETQEGELLFFMQTAGETFKDIPTLRQKSNMIDLFEVNEA